MKFALRKIFFCFTTLFLCGIVQAQKEKKKVSLKDSADGKFDLSDYIIDANGFVPVPYILTEPALGNFGGAIAPIFIKKRPPYIDTINGKVVRTPVAPDITGGAILYTANNSWAMMAFRSGTFIKSRIKYIIGGGFADINMSYYKTLPQLGEKEFKFNIRTYPAMLQMIKRLGFSRWYAGFKYLFLKTDISYDGDGSLAHFIDSLDLNRTISQLGAIVELDNRDNIFTPDKGIKFHTDLTRSDDFLGSDYDFWRMNYYMYLYKPLSKSIIAGLRVDGAQVWQDAPFYMLPYIDMRGVPINRYQGNAELLSELEFRFDLKRWSIMAFSGAGKAFDEWKDFGSSKWVVMGGTGFRYLLARKFKLRVGIDVARGPDTWAYYIVFGSNWLK